MCSARALPRVHAHKYEAGLLEESITLDAPQERVLAAAPGDGAAPGAPAAATGVVLTSPATWHCVYDGVRVVHRGALRVTFSLMLKARRVLRFAFCVFADDEARWSAMRADAASCAL